MGFAEFDPGNGILMEIVSVGTSLDVNRNSGFMIASIDFTCNANSSGVCTADDGTATIVAFEPTFDDVQRGDLSGKRVSIQVDAEGTGPGNRARYNGSVDGTL